MKSLFTVLCCLMLLPVLAERIGQVEYQLPPNLVQNWEVGNKIESEKSKTVIYIPKGISKEERKEFFGANANQYPSDLDNILSFKASLAKQFPNYQVYVDILEKGKDHLLYEWVAKEGGQERIHGWGRVFSIGSRTVVLGYQTEDIPKVAQARMDWLPALQQAKLMR